MVFQIGICDDEAGQVRVNELYIKRLAQKNRWDIACHTFSAGPDVLQYAEQRKLDLVFLDIDLGEESGIRIAEQLRMMYPGLVIIFVTGHREYTEEAFEVEAMGYLVKPFDVEKLERILKKALLQAVAWNRAEEPEEIVITDENLKKKIRTEEILYIRRQLSRSVIHTPTRDYNVYETITSLAERLGEGFIRINQSEIVAVNAIHDIHGDTIVLKSGLEFAIGRTFRKNVRNVYFGT